MSAYPTTPAFVNEGDWSSVSDSHPAMKWMHAYTERIDEGDFGALWAAGNLITPDFVYSKSNGQIFPPGRESWEALTQDYSFFTGFHHEPYFLVCWELEDGSGWAMSGNAWLFYNLPGDGSNAGITDLTGKSWQGKIPSGFHFVYKKDQSGKDGIMIATTAITSDSGPVVVELLKRGILKPSDIGL